LHVEGVQPVGQAALGTQANAVVVIHAPAVPSAPKRNNAVPPTPLGVRCMSAWCCW
jgi:hypothetical protein